MPIGTQLPPVWFKGTELLSGSTQINLANGASSVMPFLGVLDLSGYNTLSLFVTITSLVAGNTFKTILSAVDPSTGAAVAGNLGDVTLLSKTASGSYAASLYLPTYYSTLTGLILPFYQGLLTVSNTGGNVGTMHVTAIKLWLSYA